MSRFFKSAAFPIIIVVVLAFFAQKLILERRSSAKPTTWSRLRPEGRRRQVTCFKSDSGLEHRQVQRPSVDCKQDDRGRHPLAAGAGRRARAAGRRSTRRSVIDGTSDRRLALVERAHLHPAVRAVLRVLDLPDEPGAGRRQQGDELRQEPRQADVGRLAQDHVQGRCRRRRGGRGAARDQGVPREPEEVPGAGRAHPQGCAAVRPSRHRQDAAGPRGRRRGRRAVLLDLRLRLRRDVRRRRREPRPRPVRAGQAELARASSSWTRSTPSAAIAAPAWAAATTSASRR